MENTQDNLPEADGRKPGEEENPTPPSGSLPEMNDAKTSEPKSEDTDPVGSSEKQEETVAEKEVFASQDQASEETEQDQKKPGAVEEGITEKQASPVEIDVEKPEDKEAKENSETTLAENPVVEGEGTAGTREEASEEISQPDATVEAASAETGKEKAVVEITDEELEGEDSEEEVESDEDEHDQFATEELELPNYSEYPATKLVDEANQLLKNEPIQKIKEHFDSIRKNLLGQLNEERKEKLEEFISNGGVAIDFEFVQPLREKFRNIFSEYRSRRKKYYDNLREQLENNHTIKLNLIEKLKELVTKDESIGDIFKEFNHIQQEWRNTGPVPRAESSDLWRTYHHHVENFYEYIKINKELRDLDFRKNREIKEELIHKVEALVNEENVQNAFKELQKLHKEWKNTGPVERENREPMWQRFSEATKKLHDRREEFFEQLRSQREELIKKKKELVEMLKGIPTADIKTHSQWQNTIKKTESIRQEFKTIGRINHPENDEIWEQFRGILRDFNHAKNQFYKELKKEHQENLAKKRELLQIAENLKDSEDWKATTNEMKRIQAQWKRIGHVPKSESDKIWNQFRGACNHFFNRLTEHNKEKDHELEINFQKKEELMKKLEAFTPLENQKESLNALKGIIQEWKNIGRVPRDKNKIENAYNKLLDSKFAEIDMDRQESQRIRFENKMENLVDQGGDYQLRKEKDFLNRKLDEARKELAQLETNINFFSSSSASNPFVKEAEKNIEKQKRVIEDLQQKIKMLNIKMREIKKAREEEDSAEKGDNGQ